MKIWNEISSELKRKNIFLLLQKHLLNVTQRII